MNDASRTVFNATRPTQRRMTVDGFGRIEDVGKFLQMTPAAVEDLVRIGDLPYADFRGSVRIPWRAVLEYAAARLFGSQSIEPSAPVESHGEPRERLT